MLPDWFTPADESEGQVAQPAPTSELPDWFTPAGAESKPQKDWTQPQTWITENAERYKQEHGGATPYEVSLAEASDNWLTGGPPVPYVSDVYGGVQGGGAKVAELAFASAAKAAEVVGAESASDRLGDVSSGFQRIVDEIQTSGAVRREDDPYINRMLRTAVSSIAEFGTWGKAVGPLTYIATTGSRQNYVENTRRGMEGTEAVGNAVARGLQETFTTYIFGKVLGGGLERGAGIPKQSIVGRALAPTMQKLSPRAQAAAKILGQGSSEAAEEMSVELANYAIDAAYGVEDEPKELLLKLRDAGVLGALAGSGMTAAETALNSFRTDVKESAGEVETRAEEIAEATADAQSHEGDPPPTDRRGFAKATGKRQKTQAYREAYASVVESRQETATAQAEIDTQVSTQTSGQFASESFDTEGQMPNVGEVVAQPEVEPQPDIIDTTAEAQDIANAELQDVAQERFESKLDPQELTPSEVEGLNAKVRTWTQDTEFVRQIVGLGGRDVRLPQQVLDRAQELYDRDWELYDASVANLTELDIDWNRLIREYRKTEDAAGIKGYDDALMTLTRARFGDDFVQDNVDVAADELSNILDGAEIRFGKPVFPNIKEPPSREQSIAQAYEDVTEQLPPPVDPEGQVEGEWFPQQRVYMEDPTQVDYDPTLTSARNAWMRPLREYLGLTALDSPARRKWQAVLQEAKDRGVPEAALDIADRVIAKPTTLNDVETAGFVIRAAQLKQEYELALNHLMEAEARGDQYVAASSEAKAGRIEDELDRLTRALKVAGTEAGRNLAARKLTVDEDYSLATVVARARLRKGAPLTDSERRGFAARDKDLQKELKGFEEAVAARDLKAAEDAIGIGKKRARPTKAAMDQAYALVDQLLRVGCDLG